MMLRYISYNSDDTIDEIIEFEDARTKQGYRPRALQSIIDEIVTKARNNNGKVIIEFPKCKDGTPANHHSEVDCH